MSRRIASLWFPRLASERRLRDRPTTGPFAIVWKEGNAERVYCPNPAAEAEGLYRGQGVADARALCPDLCVEEVDPVADRRFLLNLARWAGRYCPWVGLEGDDGLVMDISGSTHLFGGETALADDMRAALTKAGLSVRIGLADTRGAAWALARFAEGRAAPGEAALRLAELPVAALRLDQKTCASLNRVGVRTIDALADLPRPTVTRRFGAGPLLRLDQALGRQPEEVSPLPEPKVFQVRLTLPEPIGLSRDVMAALERMLERLCSQLEAREKGARVLHLTLRRVDRASSRIELRLARAMRDAGRILALYEKHVEKIDAGFGIDQLRLEAVQVDNAPAAQISQCGAPEDARIAGADDGLADLITRLGARVGLEKIIRFLPAESHIPERGFITACAAYSEPAATWPAFSPPRPLVMFPPEPIGAKGSAPPKRFRWRAMTLTTARATGPERIAPEWWLDDPAWRSGLRDYWRVETREGRRLWLFHTPQNPAWFAQGEFA
ncbi:DNA polymerase Y family protein [Pikeienuella piscinae]|uniref:DNA-directed DNA polymerase n=1 Tax=Pikeienuella piscinae TaxID=2748098 RepID=A0A7L5BUC1_9RHOB|nr:DNA polymerase Y family protein [Pikeienuella piscinae]QIE54268.1 DNA polymerase Y family protein [Pikeienuella piscinae]